MYYAESHYNIINKYEVKRNVLKIFCSRNKRIESIVSPAENTIDILQHMDWETN